ncbi:MAG TPA: NADH-quinone oxidoreductase subunit NuoE [Bacillota bacterium]|mgnify:CR=1 FL=1|nr:NADH-quinone oxidoreductase subunit NuoE [Candidatus Fermentithermobacillaceae bacterium]HOK64531.1 NADH-quinone oxidoreductase subunit NuoE [Bacillota bacterium]HOL12044.1 NADH-quinone oxidoreductase subunit NuoE [Bacillota bacterium]HOQ03120.1 NADH-quinone oxidoreductase subunit NuoE [Bacillota bacterium]HPP60869.1 NADH-quinone oxidoreductase subunit NuoE [Bacillota bacterium]
MSNNTEHKCECAEAYLDIERIIEQNRGNRGALVQVLHYVQERLGYVPKDIQVKIAETLGVSLTEVYGVITFYSLFREKPRGKYIISSCQGTACYVRGAPDVLERLEKELGITAGDTTDDGLFTIEVVRCLGACGLAPVMTVNEDTHGRVTQDKVPAILDLYRKKEEAETVHVAGS